jgi:ubiquinone/menaquinone biosynthesis C-methylase UbiE
MNQTLTIEIVQSQWLEAILADPVTKTSLTKKENGYYNENGGFFPLADKVPDFRVHINHNEEEWKKGQDVYESWKSKQLLKAENDESIYSNEQITDAPMYQRLPLKGRVLDVGGNLGNIRKYISDNQEYCSLDPFAGLHKLADGKAMLFKYYPMHLPLNFVAGFAEFLPFKNDCFDTVNMRSCIDHFFDPMLALHEAKRVLKNNGTLIIGMTVKVNSFKNVLKESVRKVLNVFTNKFRDDHIWHPSRNEIIDLCKNCGFEIEDEIWQSENVWYVSFRKK